MDETNEERNARYIDAGHDAYAREEGWYDEPDYEPVFDYDEQSAEAQDEERNQ
jgi:hypothetical protein